MTENSEVVPKMPSSDKINIIKRIKEMKDELDALEEESKVLEASKMSAQKELDRLKGENSDLQIIKASRSKDFQACQDYEREVYFLEDEKKNLNKRIVGLNTEIRESSTYIEDLKTRLIEKNDTKDLIYSKIRWLKNNEKRLISEIQSQKASFQNLQEELVLLMNKKEVIVDNLNSMKNKEFVLGNIYQSLKEVLMVSRSLTA
ncbi:MAG: hypothetical protein HQM10_25600 [Candidatus Riflebacteria bacterium]|nr:hypothetical protein [Candidatus Riflebacteria bacterium]